MAKILICIPAMDQVATGFAKSLCTLQKKGHECVIAMELGSLVYDSRNKLAKRAVEMGADYTMWFDSDMIFEPDTMLKLLEHNLPIVSGLYFRRSPPYSPVAFDELDMEKMKWSDCEVPESLRTVGGVGFGCVLIKTEVLLDVALNFHTWFEPMKGFGEDLAFCWRARQCGYDIFLDPSVRCGHVGHMIITEEFYRAHQKALELEQGGQNDESNR